MIVVNNKQELKSEIMKYKLQGKKITIIPTMGDLHKGHFELFHKKPKHTISFVTIYVNPLQFDNKDDFIHYPRLIEKDLEKCKQNEIDLVYAPATNISDDIDFDENIDLPKFTRYLCGATRHNHFLGVYKIIKHLFSIIEPDFACFGKKDYQQLLLIKYIAKTYFPYLRIIEVDTVRENNIALSSRLRRLNNNSLERAKMIYETLLDIRRHLIKGDEFHEIKDKFINKVQSSKISIEYLEHRKSDTLENASKEITNSSLFIACSIDNIRLIDNIQL